ncbi:MAG: type IV pilus assembly protein PilM [Deltaproteobacteria bacterium]|nr:type IV pilus assembly protein PilM [Deltaproteobacteria bacterium]
MLFTPKNLVGVDIGSYSVKVVSLEGAKGAYSLKAAACFKLPRESDLPGVSPGFLSEMIRSQGIKGRKAAALMSGPSLIFKHLHLPMMPEKDLKEAVKWEVRKDLAISVSANDLITDYVIAGKGRTAENVNSIIAFAAVRADVDKVISLFKGAGLELRVLDVVPSALLASFDMNNAWEEGVNYAMFDIGETRSTLAILKDKKLSFAREISMGGVDLTARLASGMEKSEEESEEYKIAFGLTLDHGEEDNPARKLLASSIERLCSELQRSFDYFQAQFREGSVSKVFLSGGTARLKGIEASMTEIMGIPCFIDDPLRAIKIPRSFDTKTLNDIAPCLTVAAGLSARTY